jgi:hypothetical protein
MGADVPIMSLPLVRDSLAEEHALARPGVHHHLPIHQFRSALLRDARQHKLHTCYLGYVCGGEIDMPQVAALNGCVCMLHRSCSGTITAISNMSRFNLHLR